MRPSGYPENGILSIYFNQDKSRIAVGTKTGTKIYTTDPFELVHEKVGDDVSIVAMHYNTHLVAHVGAGESSQSSQRCLRMINMSRQKEITRKNFGKAILDVQLNRDRLVVVLETAIFIYELKTMEHLHTIEEIPENPQGICALPTLEGVQSLTKPVGGAFNYLAYPNNNTRGFVHIYDVVNLRAGPVIEAHNSRVSCLSFNDAGTMLATASTKGTVFRVFSMPTGEKVHEFRRGLATNAMIYSMAFDIRTTLLCVSSDKQTIHLFKLESNNEPDQAPGWRNYLSTAVTSATDYFPTSVSEMWTQSRSFAQVTLKKYGTPNLVALSGTDQVFVLVATSDGYLYKYAVDLEKGGDCECEVTYTLTKNTPKITEVAQTTPQSLQPNDHDQHQHQQNLDDDSNEISAPQT
eukprot:m.168089 g.168089  ORF g.168089 m.168089 type:complete len:407 (+) comp31491_c0_seq1:47-1267(+)